MEPEGSLLHSQESANRPYTVPEESILTPCFLKIHLNIVLPSTPMSLNWSLSCTFSDQSFEYISHLSHARYFLTHVIILDVTI